MNEQKVKSGKVKIKVEMNNSNNYSRIKVNNSQDNYINLTLFMEI